MGCACGLYVDEEKCKEDFVWKLENIYIYIYISWKIKKQMGATELVWEGLIAGHAVIPIYSALH